MIDTNTTDKSYRFVAFHINDKIQLEVAVQNLFNAIKFGICVNPIVFAPLSIYKPENVDENNWISFPDNINSVPKQKNFIINFCESRNYNGFLHIIEGGVKLNNNTLQYVNKLENTMLALDYDIHFSTATDRCNYLFSKFCPRITIDVDDDNIKNKLGLPDKISFTSHSNTSYLTFNMSALHAGVPKFDERFTIGMFYIIEFLARRRATRRDDQLYYMNQYMSILDEVGGYDIVQKGIQENNDEKTMATENELFKSLNIDYAPDNNLDVVLDAFYNKLKSKNI